MNLKRGKKVKFNERVIIYPLYVWNFAYREARKSTWMQEAIDRYRFRRRIQELEKLLEPILKNVIKRNDDVAQ